MSAKCRFTTMLGALSAEERRVLLAHERAHLAHRHARLCTAVTLAAAANPFLAPVRDAVAFLVERWADERAAGVVCDRASTDRAITRRIAALQADPPPQLWALATTVLALGALTALCAADATGDLLRLLEPVIARGRSRDGQVEPQALGRRG
ncbi:M48 family metalloprotease [Streptomyces sp. NPDC020951]|uniref:M48 family metalloprotease n=1 Tax=Streptomyces sp. NPDC020951 TaxID=3365104 RepID=UPI0037BCBEFC